MPKEDGTLNLSEVNDAIRAIVLNNLNEETGEISEVAVKQLDELECTREQKFLRCAKSIEDHEARAAGIAAKIKSLQSRKKGHDRDAEFYRNWLAINGENGETFEDDEVRIKVSEGTRVWLTDLEALQVAAPELLNYGKMPDAKLDMVQAKRYVKAHAGKVPDGMGHTLHHRTIRIK